MKVYYGFNQIKSSLKNSVVTAGVFDGVHRGHQKILKSLLKEARKINGTSVVLTFYPHPDTITPAHQKKSLLITSLEHRLRLLSEYNVDVVIVLKFTEKFYSIKPETFVKDILVKKLGTKAAVVGEDWRFGKNAKGSFRLLKEFGKEYKFNVIGVKRLKIRNENCRSSVIRNLIKSGNLKKANMLMGRRFSLMGEVKHRSGIGKGLGFPTANIDVHNEVLPPQGVYTAIVKQIAPHKEQIGVLSIGTRPTFFGKSIEVEVYIFDEKKSLYGKTIEVIPLNFIRKQKKFKTQEQLKEAMSRDVEITEAMVKKAKNNEI
jgi:riboflavin kinase/FMN adenylyltransferase